MSHQLLSISPVDGRYNKVTSVLSDYFSEYALIRYRVRVEVEYFIALCRLPLPQLAGVPESAKQRSRRHFSSIITACTWSRIWCRNSVFRQTVLMKACSKKKPAGKTFLCNSIIFMSELCKISSHSILMTTERVNFRSIFAVNVSSH